MVMFPWTVTPMGTSTMPSSAWKLRMESMESWEAEVKTRSSPSKTSTKGLQPVLREGGRDEVKVLVGKDKEGERRED